MKSLKVAISYVKTKRFEVYDKILKSYKSLMQDENIDELIKYVESLYRSHLKAKINIETLNLTSEEIRRQIDIREDNLQFMSSALLEKFSLDDTTKIMSLYSELAKRETELQKLGNVTFLTKRKVVNEIYKEMKEEEKTL